MNPTSEAWEDTGKFSRRKLDVKFELRERIQPGRERAAHKPKAHQVTFLK
jgi:hypothetical protein